MSLLLPDELKQLWLSVEQHRLDQRTFGLEQARLLDKYRSCWSDALKLEGQASLEDSIIAELGLYTACPDMNELRERCKLGAASVARDWERSHPDNQRSIQDFYDQSTSYIYDLMWWHTLVDDMSALAYVTALEFAERNACHDHLDFGGGVGSGNLLFVRNGFESTYADISSSLLGFSKWRFDIRKLPGVEFLDLKVASLPREAFDMITAMDVFEHLAEPEHAVEDIWRALKPGGFLFGRFAVEADDEDHPQHIVHDFAPTMERMRSLGLHEVWRDEWLWGNQAFQKQ